MVKAKARRELGEMKKLAGELPRSKVLHLPSPSVAFVRELSRLERGNRETVFPIGDLGDQKEQPRNLNGQRTTRTGPRRKGRVK